MGTFPGGSDVVHKKELGGFSTAITEVNKNENFNILYYCSDKILQKCLDFF